MRGHILKNLFLLTLSTLFLVVGMVIIVYALTPVPAIDSLDNLRSRQSIVITDRHGAFLYDFSENEQRTSVLYDDISSNVVQATIAVEDHKFFEHFGIRFDSLVRAFVHNARTLSFSQGGSTITQQVIKNVFFTNEKKIERKVKEFFLAPKIEQHLSKEQILELYFNTISYGGVIYGIAEATDTFFGKTPSEITVAEAAYLAAIPKAPTYYSPYGSNKPELEQRKNVVLELMLRNKFITRQEYLLAKEEVVHFQKQGEFSVNAPHFVFYVKEELEKVYGPSLRELEGEIIQTTLDFTLHSEVEALAVEYSREMERRFGAKNIAVVVLGTQTGEILAMVGSKDYFDAEIDGNVNITTSLRQPGSTFKPFAYATAFEKGFVDETLVYDVPTQFGVECDEDLFESIEDEFCYSPVNYTDKFTGPVSLRNALAQSINIPAIKTLYLAGVANTIETAQRFGITSLTQPPHHYGLSLVLGGAEVRPLELAQAYAVFANNGRFISTKWEPFEKLAVQHNIKDGTQVISERSAKYITSILSDNEARAPVFGYNSALNITSPHVAAKTGTTNNSRDIWVVGYSPDVTVLVWAGNSDSELLENNAAGASLGRLFKQIMLRATEQYESSNTLFDLTLDPEAVRQTMLYGYLERDNLHTLLHFATKHNPTLAPKEPEEDSQYSHWEFGVQKWLEENTIDEALFTKQFGGGQEYIRFAILAPQVGIKLDRKAPAQVIVSPLNFQNVQYEFYVNGVLVGSSHLPFFTITPDETVSRREDELLLEVVVNTPQGTFYAEQRYKL